MIHIPVYTGKYYLILLHTNTHALILVYMCIHAKGLRAAGAVHDTASESWAGPPTGRRHQAQWPGSELRSSSSMWEFVPSRIRKGVKLRCQWSPPATAAGTGPLPVEARAAGRGGPGPARTLQLVTGAGRQLSKCWATAGDPLQLAPYPTDCCIPMSKFYCFKTEYYSIIFKFIYLRMCFQIIRTVFSLDWTLTACLFCGKIL
jgi:hypothetical protein